MNKEVAQSITTEINNRIIQTLIDYINSIQDQERKEAAYSAAYTLADVWLPYLTAAQFQQLCDADPRPIESIFKS